MGGGGGKKKNIKEKGEKAKNYFGFY